MKKLGKQLFQVCNVLVDFSFLILAKSSNGKHLPFVIAMPELLRSAKLAVEKGQAQGRNESYVKQLTDYIIPALVEALHKVMVLLYKT